MKLTVLALVALAQFGAVAAVRANTVPVPVALEKVDLGSDTSIQNVQDSTPPAPNPTPAPDVDRKVDVNVTVGDSATPGDWYAQPVWIAIFVIGGIVVLTLLALAMRGSGAQGGATVVKG